jgi:hypothetical protein
VPVEKLAARARISKLLLKSGFPVYGREAFVRKNKIAVKITTMNLLKLLDITVVMYTISCVVQKIIDRLQKKKP